MRRRVRVVLAALVVGGLAVALLVLARSPDDNTIARLGVATVLALVLVALVGETRDIGSRFAFAGAAIFWLASVAHTAATSSVALWLVDQDMGHVEAPFPRLASFGATVSVLAFLLAVGALVWVRLGVRGRARLAERVRTLRAPRDGAAAD
jgi:hypothetical protein